MTDETECKHFEHGCCELFKQTCGAPCPYYLGLVYMAKQKVKRLGYEDVMEQEVIEPTAAENEPRTTVVDYKFAVATWNNTHNESVFQCWEDTLGAALQNAKNCATTDNKEYTILEIVYVVQPVINAEVFKATSLLPKKKNR